MRFINQSYFIIDVVVVYIDFMYVPPSNMAPKILKIKLPNWHNHFKISNNILFSRHISHNNKLYKRGQTKSLIKWSMNKQKLF